MKTIALLLLTCTLAHSATLSFEWGMADIGTTDYNLYGILGTVTNRLGTTAGINSTNITVTVTPNGSWRFQATAIYPEGESQPSNVVPVSVQPASAPTVFQPLISTVGGTRNVSVTWTAVPHDYYTTNYIAHLTRANDDWTILTTNTTAVFTGLQKNGHYEFTVVGVNMTGEGIPGVKSFNIVGNPPKALKVDQ
jgi:hypothetical protein